jgi:hypothetical protein
MEKPVFVWRRQARPALAKEGRRVCVLDLDLMHGTVASMLQIQPDKTIIDLVRRIDDPMQDNPPAPQNKSMHGPQSCITVTSRVRKWAQKNVCAANGTAVI